MATSVKYPQSNDAEFTNGTQAYSNDGNYATAAPAANATINGFWYNFDFQVPAGSAIESISVEIEWKLSTTASIHTLGLQCFLGAVAMGTEGTTTSEPTVDTVRTKSTLNGSWLASQINDNSSAGFQVRIRSTRGNDADAVTCSVDYIKVTITYAIEDSTQQTLSQDLTSPVIDAVGTAELMVAETDHELVNDNAIVQAVGTAELMVAETDHELVNDNAIVQAEAVAVLLDPENITKAFMHDASVGFTDFTIQANEDTLNDVQLLPNPIGANDAFYYLLSGKDLEGLWINVSTAGTGTYTLVWEYYNGSWIAIPNISWFQSAQAYKTAGVQKLDIQIPTDMADVAINGVTGKWIRARYVSGIVTVAPLAGRIRVYEFASFSTTFSPTYVESVSFSELIIKTIYQNVGGSVSFTELVSKNLSHPFTDVINFTELISKNTRHPISDTVNFSESFVKQINKNVSDNVILTESFAKTIIHRLSELVSFAEFTSAEGDWRKVIRDFVYFYESVTKTLFKYQSEKVFLWESISKSFRKPISNAIAFTENILQNFTKRHHEYLAFYELAPRKTITHFIQDTLVSLEEKMATLIKPTHRVILFWKSDRAYFNEYINKQIEKYDNEQVEFDEDFSARLIKPNKITLFWQMDRVRFKESFSKTVKVYKSEDVSFLMTYSKNSAYLIQDNVTFIESFIKTVIKKVVDVIPFSEVVNTLLTVPLYFDAGRVEPQYVITDLRIYGGAEMQFYAGQTADIRWKHRRFDDDTLYDPDSHTIVIYDSRNVQRVAYDITKLLKESTGVYKYYFTLPSDVIVGDWYAKITATKGTATTVLTIHFNVKEK